MKKVNLTSIVVSGFCLVATESIKANEMEKCILIGEDGKGIIKPKMCDCAAKGKYSCAGSNPAGDPDAWIFLPKGVCEKIVGGKVISSS